MEKRIVWSLLLFLLIACTDEDQFVESKVDQYVKSQTTFVLLDTLSANLSTILIDSIETLDMENMLVGKYIDDEFGPVASSAAFELYPPGSISDDENEVFDSLTLVLGFGDLAYGDTLQPQTLKVHRLLEELETDEDGVIYNTTKFEYDDTPLGEVTYIPRPFKDDSVVIRLDDALGEEFFNLMQEEDDDIASDEDFLEYFKGLVLVPEDGNTAVLSFANDSSTFMSLHTHLPGLSRSEKRYKFTFGTSSENYNHIECDRSDTPLAALSTQRVAIPSSETDNKAYLQAGAGILMRVDFPSLGRLLEFETGNIVYKVELQLQVYPGSDSQVDPPEQLLMYYTDKYNNLLSEIVDSDSETVYSNYYSDELYNEYKVYTLDLTEFVTDELSDGYIDEDIGVIVSLPEDDFKGTLDRLVIDGRNSSEYRPVLNVYCVLFE